MAMESAAALNDVLSRSGPEFLEGALERYEKRCRSRVEAAQNLSRQLGRFMFVASPGDGPAHFAFNFGLNLAGPSGLGLAPGLLLLAGMAVLTFMVVLVIWRTGGLWTAAGD